MPERSYQTETNAAPREYDRPLGSVLHEIKDELKDFAAVRFAMLRAELGDALNAWKLSLPFLAVAVVLVATAWLLLTGALVSLIALAVGWGWSLFIIGAAYLIAGAVAGWMGYKEMKSRSLAPERTIKVLKQDQLWIQNETRAA